MNNTPQLIATLVGIVVAAMAVATFMHLSHSAMEEHAGKRFDRLEGLPAMGKKTPAGKPHKAR